MSDSKSIAFWCERVNADAKVQAEFHVNLWHFSDTKLRDFIEIGVMLSDPSALSAIQIFVPFPLRRENITDLGATFASTELAQGIFNETLSSTKKPNGKSVELRMGSKTYCHVHIFCLRVEQSTRPNLRSLRKTGAPCSQLLHQH